MTRVDSNERIYGESIFYSEDGGIKQVTLFCPNSYFLIDFIQNFQICFIIHFYQIRFLHTQFSKVAGNASSQHMQGFTPYVCTDCFSSV